MTLIARTKVTPYYGQVYIQDPGTADLPSLETGEERCVWSRHAVVVSMQSDEVGDVLIEVRTDDVERRDWELISDGHLELSGTQMEIGSIVGEDLHRVDLGRTGTLPVRLRTSGDPAAPSAVCVIVGA